MEPLILCVGIVLGVVGCIVYSLYLQVPIHERRLNDQTAALNIHEQRINEIAEKINTIIAELGNHAAQQVNGADRHAQS